MAETDPKGTAGARKAGTKMGVATRAVRTGRRRRLTCNTAITSSEKMLSIKKSAVHAIAGLTVSALFASAPCAAVTVIVKDEAPLNVQSPEGFSYLLADGAGSL